MIIGFIGGGNMAKALANQFFSSGAISPSNVYVSTGRATSLEYWKELGVHATLDIGEIIYNCDVIILAIKPQIYRQMAQNLVNLLLLRDNSIPQFTVSIMAGITMDDLDKVWIEDKIMRVMPNLSSGIGEGCIGYCIKSDPDNMAPQVLSLLGHCGQTFEIPEYQFDAFSTLAGSGPAFIFTIIDALSDGAVKMGLPRDLSLKIASQMTLGSAKMVLQTGKHPGILKNEVCSPGGMSICGIHALEKGAIRDTIINAVEETTKRCKELSK